MEEMGSSKWKVAGQILVGDEEGGRWLKHQAAIRLNRTASVKFKNPRSGFSNFVAVGFYPMAADI
jgi:hypothetical protein